MKHLRLVVVVLLLVLAAACQPTGDPRCDHNAGPVSFAEDLGYHQDCEPPWSAAGKPLGWTEHATKTEWIDADRIPDNRVLLKIQWHENWHAYAAVHHITYPTQRAEECAADAFAKSKMTAAERQGVGFLAC